MLSKLLLRQNSFSVIFLEIFSFCYSVISYSLFYMTCHCLESGRFAKKLRQKRQCRNTILSYVTLHVNKNNTLTKYQVSNMLENLNKCKISNLSFKQLFGIFVIFVSFIILSIFRLFFRFPAIGRYSKDVISLHYYTQIYPYIMPCVYAFGLVAQTGSIYCTLGVTVERYIVICWPLR